MNFKKTGTAFLCFFLGMLILIGVFVIAIDPFFHYHKPLGCLQYEIYYQRYQNDGIVKHFDYNAVITGNSMSENFKASECSALFGVNAVKVPFSGATPKELDMNNRAAANANHDIKMLIMNLDWNNFIKDKDAMSYGEDDYPDYLYNSNPFDDVKYIYNKSVFNDCLKTIKYTLSGGKTTTMDEYSFWHDDPETVYGREAILANYDPGEYRGETFHLDEERYAVLSGNLNQNIIALVSENPQIDFYLFMPPYSMFFWGKMCNIGELELQFEAQEAAIELLLEHDNVHLFSFLDCFDIAQDYSRYKDYIHYDAGVNSFMLECMANGEHQITKDNCRQYLEICRDFYLNYDYTAFFAEIYGK